MPSLASRAPCYARALILFANKDKSSHLHHSHHLKQQLSCLGQFPLLRVRQTTSLFLWSFLNAGVQCDVQEDRVLRELWEEEKDQASGIKADIRERTGAATLILCHKVSSASLTTLTRDSGPGWGWGGHSGLWGRVSHIQERRGFYKPFAGDPIGHCLRACLVGVLLSPKPVFFNFCINWT